MSVVLSPKPQFVRSTTRTHGLLAATAVVFALISGLLVPLWGDTLFTGGDLLFHVRQAFSAKRMLQDGQVILMYGNDPSLALQPSFLYYTPVWYYVSALPQIIFNVSASNSILLVYGACIVTATTGMMLILRYFRVNYLVAIFCSAMFILSPYYLADLFDRVAIAEVTAFSLLPLAVYAILRCWQGRCAKHVIGCVAAIAIFVLAHKIFIAWLYVFVSVFLVVVSQKKTKTELARRTILMAAYFGLAMLITAPYWMSALANLPNMMVAGNVPSSSIFWTFLTDNGWVFSPFPHVHPAADYLRLQIGGSVLCALLLTVLLRPSRRLAWGLFAATIFSLLFVTSFFDLFPVWQYLPAPFTVIQFPYRLLMFSTLFGNLLLGVVLDQTIRRRRYSLLLAAVILSAVSASLYVKLPNRYPLLSAQAEQAPFLHHDYWEVVGQAIPDDAPFMQVPREDVEASWNWARLSLDLSEATYVRLPILFSVRLKVWDNGRQLDELRKQDNALTIYLDPGTHHIEIVRTESWVAWLLFAVGLAAFAILVLVRIASIENWSVARKSCRRRSKKIRESEAP